ncbi:uncharacterized protein LOC120341677 [Styela clava]
MALNAELRINLASLKRQDPYIGNITDSSTHVAVYSFSPQSNEWEKTDVEGTMFVYKRVAPPYWGFTILNRLSMENLTEPLTSELEFQTQNPFLLYRNAKLLIYGIWFYDQDDCKRIGELLAKLCRESSHPLANDTKAQKINIFGKLDNSILGNKESVPKSNSPTSNSVNSISPGSSVGGGQRPPSNNEEADSESEDKEVQQSTNKGSINIMDLLYKAQDKYEKEKRNTPDPVVDGAQNGMLISPTDAEMPLVKPVPIKPTHPQKLDVASLFKQQPHKPSSDPSIVNNNLPITVAPAMLPTPTMNAPFGGILPQQMVAIPTPSASVNIPNQPQRRQPRPIGRSYSLNEMAMRQHFDAYVNGNVMSVEEVEASMNRGSTANRQQEVNSTLDRMIDMINSGGGVSGNVATGVAQTPQLPGIQETVLNTLPAAPKTSSGNSGSIVVNGNHAVFHGEGEVFGKPSSLTYTGSLIHAAQPAYGQSSGTPRQRSISTSGVHVSRPNFMGVSSAPPVAVKTPFTPNFPLLPNSLTSPVQSTANSASVPLNPQVTKSTVFPTMPQSADSSLLLHGNAVISEKSSYNIPNSLVSAITTSVSAISIQDQANKVPLNTTVMPRTSKSSPAVAATLISPEDFERSSTTPQKKLELKQRMLQEVKQPIPQPNLATVPLTKQQLQQTLVSLLQKDSSFLAAIHEAYLTNFQQT